MPSVDLSRFEVLTFDCYGTLIDWEAGILAGLPAIVTAVEGRLPAVEDTMAHLRVYADSAWEPVAPNLDEARSRIAAARAAASACHPTAIVRRS